MTLFRFFALLAVIVLALSTGWLIDDKSIISKTTPLKIPDNIDYYLSGVKYRALNTQGDLHYRLRTPYLEHFIREDVSHMQQPDIDYNSEGTEWLMNSNRGLLTHKQETFELNQNASIRRVNSKRPLLLESDQIILQPSIDFIDIPKPLTLTSSQLHLQANNAKMDMKLNRYIFQRVQATYSPSQPQTSMPANHDQKSS